MRTTLTFVVAAFGSLLLTAGLVAHSEEGRTSRKTVNKPLSGPVSADQGVPTAVMAPPIDFTPEPLNRSAYGFLKPVKQNSDEVARRVHLRAYVTKTHFRILEPIRVHLKVRNISDRTMDFGYESTPHYLFEVHSRDDRLHEPPLTCYFSKKLPGLRFPIGTQPNELRPGEEGSFILVANLVQDLTEPGQYDIRVKVPFRTVEPFGDKALVRRFWMAETSDVIKVVVDPFDRNADGFGE